MNREEFEQKMAEALGGEPAEADRAAFEEALAAHDDWRREYEGAKRTLDALASLSAPGRVSARREGDRLVIEPASVSRPVRSARAGGAGRWRIAAAILIAFTAGYAAHALLILREGFVPRNQVVHVPADQHVPDDEGTAGYDVRGSGHDVRDPEHDVRNPFQSLETALARAHARRPSSSSLAKCLIAVAPRH